MPATPQIENHAFGASVFYQESPAGNIGKFGADKGGELVGRGCNGHVIPAIVGHLQVIVRTVYMVPDKVRSNPLTTGRNLEEQNLEFMNMAGLRPTSRQRRSRTSFISGVNLIISVKGL